MSEANMKDIALITVYNKQKLYDEMLSSFRNCCRDEYQYQIIALENINNSNYHSAASAYNYALDKLCDAKVCIFCHQDILFFRDSIRSIFNLCKDDASTLYGAAGVDNNGHSKQIISSMHQSAEGWKYQSLKEGEIKSCFTLDECLFACNFDLFKNIRFDEVTCDGWHLYAAELCLQCHLKGFEVKAFDAEVLHLSGGNPDHSFYECERRIVKKYRKVFSLLTFTTGWAYTNTLKYGFLRIYRFLRYGIR